MGIDLRLLPFDGDDFSHTILNCGRCPDLFGEIQLMPSQLIDGRFGTFIGDGERYGDTNSDPYGDRLKYTLVRDLLTLAEHADVRYVAKNRAIWAYLRELPTRTKVALYWH